MRKFFKKLFSDKNDINEKAIIGFAAFFIMTFFAVVDIWLGFFGKELVVNEFIFNAFLYLSLGCFGIASVDKYLNKKWGHNDREYDEDGNDYTENYDEHYHDDYHYDGDHDHNRRY